MTSGYKKKGGGIIRNVRQGRRFDKFEPGKELLALRLKRKSSHSEKGGSKKESGLPHSSLLRIGTG